MRVRHHKFYWETATGTLGLVVEKSNKLVQITNNHVGANENVDGLSPPGARKGDAITQSGPVGAVKILKTL